MLEAFSSVGYTWLASWNIFKSTFSFGSVSHTAGLSLINGAVSTVLGETNSIPIAVSLSAPSLTPLTVPIGLKLEDVKGFLSMYNLYTILLLSDLINFSQDSLKSV